MNELETRSAANRTNLIAAIEAQADMVDTGFAEARRNQAAAVAGLQASLGRNVSAAIAMASQQTDARLSAMMHMMSQLTGMPTPPLPPIGQPQIGHGQGTQPQIGNGEATSGQLPQITLAGHHFAVAQETAQPAALAASGYEAARTRAREALGAAGAFGNAQGAAEATTDLPAGATPSSTGPPP